jgi:CDP-glucose 4,6-dehydratase
VYSGPGFQTRKRAVLDAAFWLNRRIFMTGHTGFKGAWASLLLKRLGASVTGYAWPPLNDPDIFNVAGVFSDVSHVEGDVRDLDALVGSMRAAKPELVIHMAAQALVRQSYAMPVETFAINVMGTVNVLEAVRRVPSVRGVVIVTSDKCYDNKEWDWGYRETEAMGGYDPYSNSKGCAELVTAAYRSSFFAAGECCVASARAGNVVGGGDWALDRLVPDAMRAFMRGETLRIRNPLSIRPWQHVLESVNAYLILAQHLAGGGGNGDNGRDVAEAWNFGPGSESEIAVGDVVERLARHWGPGATWTVDPGPHPHEASFLKLDCAKARIRLGWAPRINVEDALHMGVSWYRAYRDGANMRAVTLAQIDEFLRREAT